MSDSDDEVVTYFFFKLFEISREQTKTQNNLDSVIES